MFSKSILIVGGFIAATAFLSGCGGGSSSTTTITTPSVTVTASAASVDPTDAVKLSATVANDSRNAGVSWTVSGGGTLSGTSISAATYTAPAAAAAAQTVTVTATSIADPAASNSVTLTVPALLTVTTTDAQLTSTAATLNTMQLTATGGIPLYSGSTPGYLWGVAPGSTLPAGWTLDPNGLLVPPATWGNWSGAFNFTANLVDGGESVPQTASAPLAVVVTPSPSGAHNSYLSGTWVCSLNGAFDKDGARWAALTSFQTDGKGDITSGAIDENSRDFTAALSGTVTGSYAIGADNNGLLTSQITWSGGSTVTRSFAIALNNLAGPAAARARLVEIDDAGATPSGQHGAGICYPATTSAFTAATLNGNFVYKTDGETSTGAPQTHVGRYTASNGQITAGYQDYVILPGTTKGNNTFTGSYTAPDPATGRYTESWDMSTSSTPTQSVEYIVSATQFYRLVTVANGGLLSGDVDAQTATSFTSSSLKGTIVSYGNGRAYSNGSVSGLDSWVNQGTADGNGNLTINQSYTNANGTYASGSQNDQIIAITFDSTNPGRATFTPSGGGYGFGSAVRASLKRGCVAVEP